MRIILTQESKDIIGSDGLMIVDGRFNLQSVILEVEKRNKSMQKNFKHKIADGFYFLNSNFKKSSKIYNLR